jgi:RNA polymerase sigma-70 factor (ECF subfamily)
LPVEIELEEVAASVAGGGFAGDVIAAYDANERDLYSFALAVTRDPGAAEDLVQEAYLRLVREASRGRFPNTPRAWLYRVVVNLARTRARRRFVADRWRSLMVNRDVAASPEEDVARRELGVALHAALGSIPTEARIAFLLATDGHSGREVAALIGRSEGATRTLLWRARRGLRRTMESEAAE